MARPDTRVIRYSHGYYIKQESELNPKGNRYLGPFDTTADLEIFAHRVIARAKQYELKEQEAEEDGAA